MAGASVPFQLVFPTIGVCLPVTFGICPGDYPIVGTASGGIGVKRAPRAPEAPAIAWTDLRRVAEVGAQSVKRERFQRFHPQRFEERLEPFALEAGERFAPPRQIAVGRGRQ